MKLESYTFDAPALWACALIYGDLSGLDYYGPEAIAEFEAWCADNPEDASNVVGCDAEWIGTFNGLQTEMLTYSALNRVEE